MLYQTDDNLVKQINYNIIETSICKILKNLKNVPYDECEYNPQYIEFLMNISFSKEKPNKHTIALIQKALDKEANFKALLFLAKRGNEVQLALSL